MPPVDSSTLPALTAFTSLLALLRGRAGGDGLRHLLAVLVPALFAGFGAVTTGHRAAGEGKGAQEEGNTAGSAHADQNERNTQVGV
jgi:hypothetical protein